MAMYDLVIKGGTVVNSDGSFKADIGVKDGKIACIAGELSDAAQIYDAAGKLVIPGGIDIHTHIDAPINGSHTLDDWYQGTVSAACGGVTCVVDYPMQEKGLTLRGILDKWSRKAEGSAVIDYSFSPVITQRTEEAYADLPRLIEDVFPTCKVYMAFCPRARHEALPLWLEARPGLGGLLPGRLDVGPGLCEDVIICERVGAALVVVADAGGDVLDGHVAEVAEVVAVQGHGPGVEAQGLERVVDVVGLPLVVAEVAPDGQGVPRAAGAVDDYPADPVADLAGVLPGDFFQCCHAGASSLMMRTTVTRSSMSCLVM